MTIEPFIGSNRYSQTTKEWRITLAKAVGTKPNMVEPCRAQSDLGAPFEPAM